MRALTRLLLAWSLVSIAACELATHAFDYQIAPPAAPAPSVCAPCPTGADLRIPPCPVDDPSPDLGRPFVFAARRSHLGHPADIVSPLFDFGLDLDCSTRPGGLPVLCVPLSETGWSALPHGIDDALLTRVLAPAYLASATGAAVDLDAVVSGALERGRYGVVVSVRDWNGLPDDPSVEVTLRTSPGLGSGAVPAWAGSDEWLPYPDVDADGVRRLALYDVSGYVSGGTLVVDARSLGASLFRVGPRGASLDLLLGRLVFIGFLTPTALAGFTMTGMIDQPSARAAVLAFGNPLAPCAGAAGAFVASLSPEVAVAPDMPFAPTPDASAPCDGISFAWSLDAEPAILASEAGDGGVDGGAPCP